MIDNPKEFYRNLDSFLSEIYKVGADDILSTVLKELVDFLGKDLNIRNGRLYDLILDKFVLVASTHLANGEDSKEELDLIDENLQLVLQNGCYIFHDPLNCFDVKKIPSDEFTPLVAFVVQKEETVRLFVFELEGGWDREHIELSINTTRKVLNARMMSESVKNTLYQAELIQRSLLPKNSPDIEGYDIFGKSISAEIVGGDLYDYIIFKDGQFGVAIGDASGHGLPAALLVRDVVTGLRMGLEKEMKISPVLEKLNRVIHRSTLSTSFISLFYAEIEMNGDLVYVNAGHPDPLLIQGKKVEQLHDGGTVLGPLAEVKLKRGFTRMLPGSILVLYSDGLPERQNSSGKMFGLKRLKEIVIKNQHLSSEDMSNKIIDEVHKYGNSSRWQDDATLVIVKRNEIE